MAKNFTVIQGVTADGVPINPMLGSKTIDLLEELFQVKPQVGMVYKGRHVTRISMIKGVAPNDDLYRASLAYNGNDETPMINYVEKGKHYTVSAGEFLEWLGKGDFVAEPAPEVKPPEAVAFDKFADNVVKAQAPELKHKEKTKKEKASKKPSYKPVKRKKS